MDAKQFRRISKAIADPGRYQILSQIARARKKLSCGEAGCDLGVTPATLSHHVKELRAAGLINVERRGKFHFLSLRRKVWRDYLSRLATIR